MKRVWAAVVATAMGCLLVAPMQPALADGSTIGHPDHIVVVIMENHSSGQVVGNANAPYISSLASNGAWMTQSYAIRHPSEPNYLALFSGSTQGVTDDSCPHSYTTPNMGSALINAAKTFATYSEDLPSVGFTGCTSGKYARKHNPAVNFTDLAPATNLPMTAFPTDFTTLPTVSYVVPNLSHDMHDGTVAQGDLWLQTNLSGYATWARQHNSLLVVTFDEDDNATGNLIPTVITGANVVPGSYSQVINHYSILRMIEDAYGLAPIGASTTAASITGIWGAPGNLPPTASFTSAMAGLSVSFDGSASADPDGTITGYTWDFGDGTTGSGVTPTHTFPGPGSYLVTLRVTDSAGAQGVWSGVLALTSLGASDTFGRTVANGWGNADVGGAWTVSGNATAYGVSAGVGRIAMSAGGGPSAYLNGVSTSDADVQATVSTDKPATGSGLYVSIVGRRVVGTGDYRVKLRFASTGVLALTLERVSSTGVETALTPDTVVPGPTYTAGEQLRVRLQVSGVGTTTLRARIWRVAAAQPATWLVTSTDTTAAMQVKGGLGFVGYLSSAATNAPISVSVDDLVSSATNQPPVAAFTPTCTNLSCTFDSSGSTDPDGTIASYAWTFDGTTSTATSPTHVFPAGGTYPVTLTVTDNQGAASPVATGSVTVTPPPNVPPVARFTQSCINLVCTFNATGSTDSDGTITGYAWTFGDNATASGVTPSHTYGTGGSYPVTLTVTDNAGGTGTASSTVSPTALYAFDTFTRTTATGWGSADRGGAWTTSNSSSTFVRGGAGSITMGAPSSGPSIYLTGVSSTDSDVQVTLTTDKAPTGGGIYVSLIGRRIVGVADYRAKVRLLSTGQVSLSIVRVTSAGVETTIKPESVVAGLTYTATTRLRLRFQVTGTGSTTLRSKIWLASAAEPTTWNQTATDATAGLQVAGSYGLMAYLSGTATNSPIVAGFDDFQAGPTG